MFIMVQIYFDNVNRVPKDFAAMQGFLKEAKRSDSPSGYLEKFLVALKDLKKILLRAPNDIKKTQLGLDIRDVEKTIRLVQLGKLTLTEAMPEIKKKLRVISILTELLFKNTPKTSFN